MATISQTEINISLAFPKAGVTFEIRCGTPGGGANGHPSFKLKALDYSGARQLSFSEDTSPQLADWVGGYSRWLRRANVTASFDENGITGTFAGGLTPEQTMMGVTDACDMIRQRFEHYEESILV